MTVNASSSLNSFEAPVEKEKRPLAPVLSCSRYSLHSPRSTLTNRCCLFSFRAQEIKGGRVASRNKKGEIWFIPGSFGVLTRFFFGFESCQPVSFLSQSTLG